MFENHRGGCSGCHPGPGTHGTAVYRTSGKGFIWRCALWCTLLFGIYALFSSQRLPLFADELTNDTIREKQAQIEEAKKEQEEIRSSISDVEAIRAQLESTKSDLESYVTQLDAQLTAIQENIDDLNQQITDKEAQIDETKEELAAAEKARDDQYAAMKVRIRLLYERGDRYFLAILMEADNYADMLNKASYVRMLSDYDKKKLEDYREQVEVVTLTEQQLEEDRNTLEEAKEAVEQEQSNAQALMTEKQNELVSVSSDIAAQESAAAQYEQQLVGQDDAIASLEAQVSAEKERLAEEQRRLEEEARKKAEEEAKARAEAEARAKAQAEAEARAKAEAEAKAKAQAEAEAKARAEAEAKAKAEAEAEAKAKAEAEAKAEEAKKAAEEAAQAAAAAAAQAAQITIVYGGGTFTWPCPSYTEISSDYGYRVHPIYGTTLFHNGVDMAADAGSPILAAADGTVVAASYSSSMGNYVMIDHGGTLYTIYMHASALYVSQGQTVTAGQQIAAVGSTGNSTGPHLHFSVRLNGSYVSPWQYLNQ